MDEDQIRELLQGEQTFDDDAIRSMLQSKTGIELPGETSLSKKDTLASEFQIPDVDPDTQKALLEQYGYNAEEKAAQDQQAEQARQAEQSRLIAEQDSIRAAEQSKLAERPTFTKLMDLPAAVNREVISLLGIPGDLTNAAINLAGLEGSLGQSSLSSKNIRANAADLGIIYSDEEVPDTAATKAGTYLAEGVEFLLPFLKWGRGAAAASLTIPVTGKTAISTKLVSEGGKMVRTIPALPERVVGSIAAPFLQSPGKAWMGEAVASVGAGYGAFELGEAYGETGEMVGGLLGGALPQMALGATKQITNTAKKQFLSLSEYGAKPKVRDYFDTVTGSENIAEDMTRNQVQTLKQANLSAAKLTGEEHMLSLEKEVASNPVVFNNLKKIQKETDTLALQEMEKLGGNIRIEETQAYLKGRVDKMTYVLGERVNLAANKAKASIDPLSATEELQQINTIVRKNVEDAKLAFKSVEKAKWDKISPKVSVQTDNTLSGYKSLLAEREAFKSTAKEDVPSFVKELLGYNKVTKKKGVEARTYIPGKYKQNESLLDLKQFRTRISSEIEKSDSATQKRFLTRLRDMVTEDVYSAGGSDVAEAIAASKAVHDTFEGDIMNTIFKVDKFGKGLDERLTLGTINTTGKSGAKAAVQINKILEAAPGTYDQLENLVKVQMANSAVLQNVDGFSRLNIKSAQKYIESNKQVLDIFPTLKDDLNFAIGQEQRFIGTKGNVEARIKNLSQSTAAKMNAGKAKPGQVLPDILSSPYPEREMAKVLGQSNKTGRRGIRNDVVKKMIKDSGMDADKLTSLWAANKKVYSQPFNQYELKRFERILKTMDLNKGLRDEPPRIGKVLPPDNLLTATLLRAGGLALGHRVGRLTGSPLHATSKVMKYTEQFSNWLDSGKAQELLVKSIEDPELFKILNYNPKNITKKHIQTLMSYQLVSTVNAYDED